jgi:hypothetical protein
MAKHNSRYLRPRQKTSRSRLIANMEAAARRLSRYAERAECDLGEIGIATSLRGFAMGLRDLSDLTGERRMTLRPSVRHAARPRRDKAARSAEI